jgi:hypothetical protein
VYDKEHAIRNGNAESTTTMATASSKSALAGSISSVPFTPAITAIPAVLTPTMDPIAELTKQFSQLALAIQASMQSRPSCRDAE